MDGSQLPTEWTHHQTKLVPGVSDSKKREGSLKQFGIATKEGPMSKNNEVSDFSKMPKTSKKSTMAKESDNGINR